MKKNDTDRVIVFDTTLRDGEQAPGATLTHREKLEVANVLAALKVDVIEAGFPAASPDDFKAVHAIASSVHGPIIAGLARCVGNDIKACFKAIAPAANRRIHVFSSGSDVHLKTMLRITRAENIERSVRAVMHAKSLVRDVEYSAQDTTRADRDYLVELYLAVADAGATTLNIPDTVGYAIPAEYGSLIDYIISRVRPRFPDVVFSTHCHDDLGLAVANSLAAVSAGARQIECAINGLGERAGNSSLEEVVMALKMRRDFFQLVTGVKTRHLCRASKMVSRLTGIAVQRNKAIVGANAFAHEAGIHQDGVLKERTNYEIMVPKDVGADESQLVLGKHSGTHALLDRFTVLGVRLSADEVIRAYDAFKALADKKKVIYDDDLLAIARNIMGQEVPGGYELEYLNVSSGTGTVPTATIKLRLGKEVFQDACSGDGPIDAATKAIDRVTKVHGTIADLSIQSVTVGGDAMGEATLRVSFGGKDVFTGKAAHTDIVEATARAYLSCVNRHLARKKAK